MITSTSNPQVKTVISLMKKSGERKNRGLFVIEGIRMFVETPKDRIVKVYASESFAQDNQSLLSEYEYETVTDPVFRQMSDTQTPQGILALVEMCQYSLEDMTEGRTPLLLILENIQDPGNLGTMIRTAEGAGATGIIMSRNTVDIYNPKVIRSTMGSLYRMPFLYAEELEPLIGTLKKKGIHTYAAHLDGQSWYYEENLKEPAAIYIGNEGNGLTDTLAATADTLVKIPMEGQLESLNAAVSAAVILYESKRQRG